MKFKFLFAVAALGLLATGCSNEENPNGGPVAGGEKQGVYLTISTMKEATRAGTENDHAATVPESAVSLTTPLKVAVFNQTNAIPFDITFF